MNWTPWTPIETPCERQENAAYRIAMFRQVESKSEPVPIPRFLNTDDSGILSIGMTTSMERRRDQFVSGHIHGRGHSEANLLHILERFSALRSRYPERKYFYSYVAAATKEDAKRKERLEIKLYVIKFGEVPPLNSAIPNRYDDVEWKKVLSVSKKSA